MILPAAADIEAYKQKRRHKGRRFRIALRLVFSGCFLFHAAHGGRTGKARAEQRERERFGDAGHLARQQVERDVIAGVAEIEALRIVADRIVGESDVGRGQTGKIGIEREAHDHRAVVKRDAGKFNTVEGRGGVVAPRIFRYRDRKAGCRDRRRRGEGTANQIGAGA